MAIIKQAKNINILTKNEDIIISKTFNLKTKNKIIFDALDDNLELYSKKKIIKNGGN